jgi:hypothetical protein
MGPATSLYLYAGVLTAGKLIVEDRNGNLLREEEFDPAPLIALTFLARF